MAKIVFSALVNDVRKKTGGNVFTKGRSGAFVRRKVSPIQPRSVAQLNVRADFTYLSKLWSDPTMDNYRAGWIALAASYPKKDKFGATHNLTGLQMFVRLNRALHTIGVTAILAPPATLSAENLATLSLDASTPCVLTLSDCQTTDNETIYTYSGYTGSAPVPGMDVVITGFTHTGNNGTFKILSTTGGAAGTFTVATTTQDDETHAGTGTASGLSVTFTPTPLGANSHLVVMASKQVSAGRASSFGSPALIKAFAAATTSPQSILTEYQAKYGTLIAGRKIEISAYIVNDETGAVSQHQTAVDTVA
jgi:hypothetical protein